jgi:hypothetical protein
MPKDEAFEDLGGTDRPSFNEILKQWAKNLKFKSDGKVNPRGVGTNVAMGINPAIGFASSIPFSLIGKALFGKEGAIKDLLGIGPDNKFGVMDLGKEGGAPAGAGMSSQDLSGADVATVLGLLPTTPGVDESLSAPSSFAQVQSQGQGPSAIEIYTKLLNDAGYFSATGDPLDPRARTVAVGAGTDRSFDRFGGGFGPGMGFGGPGGVNMGQFFGRGFGGGGGGATIRYF